MNNNRKQKIILGLIFAVGLSVFLFPVVTNLINTMEHNKVIAYYQEQVKELENIDKRRLQREAAEYNERLIGGAVIRDPFAENREEVSQGVSYMDMLSIGEVMAYLEIPKIDIYLPVYHGTSDEVLTQGLGHIEQTSLPVGGVGTNSVLTGHRGLPTSTMFRHLDKLDVGDQFYVHSLDEILAYEIFETVIVKPNDVEKLRIDKNLDMVTLITCDPYMLNTNRLLVRGKRVEYIPPLEFASEDEEELPETAPATVENAPENNNDGRLLLGAGATLAVVGTVSVILFIRRRKKAGENHET